MLSKAILLTASLHALASTGPQPIDAAPVTRLSVRDSAPPAAPIRTLITTDLSRRSVRIAEWTSAGIRVASPDLPEELAAESAREIVPLDSVLAVVAPEAGEEAITPHADQDRRLQPPESGLVRVTLVDGQRFVGTISMLSGAAPRAGSEQDSKEPPLILSAASFGDLRIALDHVRDIEVLRGPGQADIPRDTKVEPASDRVVLANGDVLEGFVESIGPEVVIAPDAKDSAAAPRRLPLARCSRILLANPSEPLEGPAIWVSGPAGQIQVVRSESWSITPSGEAQITPRLPGERRSPSAVPSALILAIAPDASLLVPLSTLPPPQFTPDPSRPWSHAPQVDPGLQSPLALGDALLPGPMTATWTLPDGVVALSGAVELAPDARIWGDCTVSIERASGGSTSPIWSGRLSPDHPHQDLKASWPPASGSAVFTVKVEAGAGGHIHDQVVLKGLLFVRHASH